MTDKPEINNKNRQGYDLLTEKEARVVELMKSGETLVGKEVTDRAIDTFIDICLQSRKGWN
jgi:hypothetical protein